MASAYRWLGRLGFWLLYLTGGILLARYLLQVASGQPIDWEVVPVLAIASVLHGRARKSADVTRNGHAYSAGLPGVAYCILLVVWFLTKDFTGVDLGAGTALMLALGIDMLLALVSLFRTPWSEMAQ